jgi:drug/metabolite transporter (DMT)-like permease
MNSTTHAPKWKTLLAFAIIYFVWGSTFLAIRIGVEQVPPFLFAAMRFILAGAILFVWMIATGEGWPTRREWASILLLGSTIFVMDYGLLFWSEQRVPSGLASVMLGTIPAFMALSEIFILRTQKLTGRLGLALLVGFCGVGVLVSRSLSLGGQPVDAYGAIALTVGSISWSIAAALTKKLPLPASKGMSSGAQMLVGGILLAVLGAAFGELHDLHLEKITAGVWWALAYLVVAGSIVGFTAYIWLIHHESPTRVGTYAYVNPVVAVILGYFAAGEPLGLRTIVGTVCVLFSVIVITTAPKKPAPVVAAVPAASPVVGSDDF